MAGEKTQVPVFGPKTKWGEPVFPFMDDWFSGGGTETGIPLGKPDFILKSRNKKHQHIISCILANYISTCKDELSAWM